MFALFVGVKLVFTLRQGQTQGLPLHLLNDTLLLE